MHESAFRLHGTCITEQVFERKAVLQSVTESAPSRVNELHWYKKISPFKNLFGPLFIDLKISFFKNLKGQSL